MSGKEVRTLVDQLVADTISDLGCSHLEQSEKAALEANLVEVYGKATLAFLLRVLPQAEAKKVSLKLADLEMRDQEITRLLTHASPYERELRCELLKTQSEIKTIHARQLEEMLGRN